MLAYTQARVPVLVQLVSVTGLWGLTFVLVWFATVANWALEHREAGHRVLPGVAVYAGILVAILGFGALRLAGAGSVGAPVRVAGITVAGEVATGREAGLSRLMTGAAFGDEDWRAFAEASRAVNEELLRMSEREAARGAKLLLWSEGNAVVLAGELDALVARGARWRASGACGSACRWRASRPRWSGCCATSSSWWGRTARWRGAT